MGSERKERTVTDEPTKDRIAHYRERAAEARAKAETIRDYEARETMLQVAAMRENMAASAERHSHSN
jgi:uncharacterized protein with von Willebrand factor type A (vWA) domain